MFNPSRSPSRNQQSGGWRAYQASLSRTPSRGPRPGRRRRRLRGALLAGLLLTALLGLGLPWQGAQSRQAQQPPTAPPAVQAPSPPSAPPAEPPATAELAPVSLPAGDAPLERAQLRQILDPRAFSNLTTRELNLPLAGQPFTVETTLDAGLQNFLLDSLDRTNSRYVGIVVMDATDGRVLALAGYDRIDAGNNPCLQSEFPAASIFKIVTAAAAVDRLGYGVDTPMAFSGAKHTLYKQQLTDKRHRSDTTIPLGKAFAESINPVFGKLGSLRLGKEQLAQAAANFGFNQPLDFELPLPPSQFHIGDEPYNWAEIASGFNRETTLSPLHGAALAAAIANGGRMPTPTLIERISDAQGEERYRRRTPAPSSPLIAPRTAAAMEQMMETTIDSGTARKAFRNYQKDRVLAGLQIGGKTGSLDNATHDLRYDWFVGFARESGGGRALAVAVLVAHQEFIGIRAGDYARRTFHYYFGNALAKR